MVVIVFGLPGSGKSYFASRLAPAIDAEYLNSDVLRKKLLPNRNYSEEEKLEVYDKMLLRMRQAISENKSLVIDATFYKDEIRKEFIRQAGNDIFFIEVRADEELIRERLKQKRTASEADFKVYKIVEAEFEPMQEPHLVLRSRDNNLNEMLTEALHYLTRDN